MSVFCGDDKAKGKTVQVGEQEIVKFGMQFGTTCHQGNRHFELLLGHSLEPTRVGLSEPDHDHRLDPGLSFLEHGEPGAFPGTSTYPKGVGGGPLTQGAAPLAPRVGSSATCGASDQADHWGGGSNPQRLTPGPSDRCPPQALIT